MTKAPLHSGRTDGPSGNAFTDFASGKIFQLVSRHSALFLFVCIAGVVAVVFSHFFLPSYRSRSTLILQAAINNPLQSLSARLGGFSGFDVDGREADRYLSRLRVHTYFLQAAKDVKEEPYLRALPESEFVSGKTLRMLYKERFERRASRLVSELSDEELADRLLQMITFNKDGIEAVSVHTVTISSEISYRLTNVAAQTAISALTEFDVRELQDSDFLLKIQAGRTKESINETEAAIAHFKRSKQLFSTNTNFEDATSRASELKRELAEIKSKKEENNTEMELIRKTESNPADNSSYDPGYKFGLGRKLEVLRRENETFSAQERSLRANLAALYQTYDEGAEQRLLDLKKKLELDTSMYQELTKHNFQMEMRKLSAKNKFRILEVARSHNVQPSENLLSKLIVVIIICLAFSSLIAYAIERAFPLVGGRSDLEDAGLIVIGSIPLGPESVAKKAGKAGWWNRRKWAHLRPKQARMARELSTAITRVCSFIINKRETSSANELSGWVITITSSLPGEGKSFTAEKLAKGLAEFQYKVLLIDGDLRSPAVSQQHNAGKAQGLSDVIEDKKLFGKARIKKIHKGLDFLPAGLSRENPARLIASQGFSSLMKDLRAIYDFIIIDTPPVCVAGDSANVTKVADFPIVVVGMNEIYSQMLYNSVGGISAFYSGPLYGILNKVPLGYQYGYGYGYGFSHYHRAGRYVEAEFENKDKPPPGVQVV